VVFTLSIESGFIIEIKPESDIYGKLPEIRILEIKSFSCNGCVAYLGAVQLFLDRQF